MLQQLKCAGISLPVPILSALHVATLELSSYFACANSCAETDKRPATCANARVHIGAGVRGNTRASAPADWFASAGVITRASALADTPLRCKQHGKRCFGPHVRKHATARNSPVYFISYSELHVAKLASVLKTAADKRPAQPPKQVCLALPMNAQQKHAQLHKAWILQGISV